MQRFCATTLVQAKSDVSLRSGGVLYCTHPTSPQTILFTHGPSSGLSCLRLAAGQQRHSDAWPDYRSQQIHSSGRAVPESRCGFTFHIHISRSQRCSFTSSYFPGGFAHVYLVRTTQPVHGTTHHVLKRIAVQNESMLTEVKKEVDIMVRSFFFTSCYSVRCVCQCSVSSKDIPTSCILSTLLGIECPMGCMKSSSSWNSVKAEESST